MGREIPPTMGDRFFVRPGSPSNRLFAPLVDQLANVRRWNAEREWGFTRAELAAIDITPRTHPSPLVVDVVAVYLNAERQRDGLDGVRRTCHELWDVVAQRYLNTWSWDWLPQTYYGHRKPVRLLAGIEHRPGVRRVTVDLGAHWTPGRHVRPRAIRGRNSAHAEILAAAAHFPRWAKAMDGINVPYVWLPGYQVTVPEYAVNTRLPGLAWVHYRRTLSLTVNWADHAHSGWAAPTCR
jgi:hypothetical protein